MKFKLDENLGHFIKEIFISAGYDTHSVHDENLSGASDQKIFKECQNEKRCLVTLDLDFSDITKFKPETSAGIIVLRPDKHYGIEMLVQISKLALNVIHDQDPTGRLIIIGPSRFRIHQNHEH